MRADGYSLVPTVRLDLSVRRREKRERGERREIVERTEERPGQRDET